MQTDPNADRWWAAVHGRLCVGCGVRRQAALQSSEPTPWPYTTPRSTSLACPAQVPFASISRVIRHMDQVICEADRMYRTVMQRHSANAQMVKLYASYLECEKLLGSCVRGCSARTSYICALSISQAPVVLLFS